MTIKYGTKTERLMSIAFNSKTTYGDDDDDKYTKKENKKIYRHYNYKFSQQKNATRKSAIQMSINNNARFCY